MLLGETIAEYKGVLTGYISDDTKEYAQSKKVVDDFLKLYYETIPEF